MKVLADFATDKADIATAISDCKNIKKYNTVQGEGMSIINCIKDITSTIS